MAANVKEKDAAQIRKEFLAALADVTTTAQALSSVFNAKVATDHFSAGRNQRESEKSTSAIQVLRFHYQDALDKFLESDEATSTLSSLLDAAKERNRKIDEELAKNPSPNAPYHKPRATDANHGAARPGPRTEQK